MVEEETESHRVKLPAQGHRAHRCGRPRVGKNLKVFVEPRPSPELRGERRGPRPAQTVPSLCTQPEESVNVSGREEPHPVAGARFHNNTSDRETQAPPASGVRSEQQHLFT